ncbi:hypothetical protein A6X21_20060 [Planctopirus hydrillae]|uniref:Uncharacterized protein n=1 Tax=Planctopirus hydrillae TaxID=1841610 RepID=A0A1C3EHD0_9PLAN|nr:hypothetical protein A6X21_20060 [Planctopirus hydrillae]
MTGQDQCTIPHIFETCGSDFAGNFQEGIAPENLALYCAGTALISYERQIPSAFRVIQLSGIRSE